MSAEVEKGNNEETNGQTNGATDVISTTIEKPRKPLKQLLLDNWQIIIKLIELLLCIAALVFVCEPAKVTGLGSSHMHHIGIMYTAYTGYILIISVLLLGRYMGDRLPYKTSMIFSVCGASIFLITATLLISTRSHLTRMHIFHPNAYLMVMLMTSIIIAFINAIVFVIDAVLTFRRQESL